MPITATAVAAHQSVRLSDTLTVSVLVAGQSPLRVELPKDLLTEESALIWKIEPIGSATLAEGGNGTTRWEQAFRMSPFVPGDAVPIGFRPLTVGTETVSVEPISVRVTTSLNSAKAEDVRPVTGIETLLAPPNNSWGFGPVFLVVVGILFIGVVIFALLRRRGKPETIPPHEWAIGQLAAVSTNSRSVEQVEQLTAVVRGYVSRRFGLAVDPCTTAELLRVGDLRGIWNENTKRRVKSLFNVFDQVKFAGHSVALNEPARWVEQVRELVCNWATPDSLTAEQ